MPGFAFGGHAFTIIDKTALYWPDQQALLVADLHLEKGSWFAERGQMLPPWDSMATLDRLEQAARTANARSIWALGDNFHDSLGPERMADETRDRLNELDRAFQINWIIGNHDEALDSTISGAVHTETEMAGIILRHKALLLPSLPEISGHWHPKFRLSARGRRVTRPCFVLGERRLILPAFGAYTGGMDACDPGIVTLAGAGACALIEAGGSIRSFPLQ